MIKLVMIRFAKTFEFELFISLQSSSFFLLFLIVVKEFATKFWLQTINVQTKTERIDFTHLVLLQSF